jgi:hypothetical protein
MDYAPSNVLLILILDLICSRNTTARQQHGNFIQWVTETLMTSLQS